MQRMACYGEEVFGIYQSQAIMTNMSFTPLTKVVPTGRIDESRAVRNQNKKQAGKKTRHNELYL